MSDPRVFKARPSWGWAWLGGIGALAAVPALAALPVLATPVWFSGLLSLLVAAAVGVPMLLLAAWFPTMRYELDDTALTLRYGPVLTYRIPLAEIRQVRQKTLSISLYSSLRLPGLALFRVYYNDEGNVLMCASAAADRILLVETAQAKYGLTPADEAVFTTALTARLGTPHA